MKRLYEIVLYQPLFNALILLTVWIPGHSLGWAIVVLTIIIRFLLMPSAAHAIRQQHKLQRLQPELKELQERHKENKEVLARETMALYKKYDIHPLGSCLPMLIQLPILIALYQVFWGGLDESRFNLLYSFVSRPEIVNHIFLGMDLTKPSIVLAIIAGLLQFWQSWMLMRDPRRVHQSSEPVQKIMTTQLLYVMPVITVVISLSLPAALPLYWAVTNLFAIVQQWYLFRDLPKPDRIEPAAPISADKRATAPQTETRGAVTVTIRKKG